MAFVPREPTRKVHITRILGTNKAGDVLPDIWADVERFEIYTKVTQSAANQPQQVDTKFRWHDDPDGDDYRPEDDKGTARATTVLKICSPDEADLNDPEEWVPVRVIKRVHLTHGDEVGSDTNQRYITEELTADRKVKLRRVSHYDTSIDGAAEAAFDDPERRAYVAKAKDYEKDDETKDEGQYIECEIVTAIDKQVSAHAQSNGTDQQVIVKFKNQYLIDETDEASLEEVGTNNKNPPYRLDPFQNIVNVQFAVLKQVVIGMPRTGFSGNPDTISTKDGKEFDTAKFGSDTYSGASGLGKTVIGNDYHLVAFGKPRDGPSCFILVDGNWFGGEVNTIRRGVLDDDGQLVWSTIGSFPSVTSSAGELGAMSCSFAGGGFFIQYLVGGEDGSDDLHMSVSFDGMSFTHDIRPFAGVHATGVCNPDGAGSIFGPRPIGGSVAYDKENGVYVTTGSFERTYNYEYIVHGTIDDTLNGTAVDRNFMSSVSTNGTSWTPKFDLSEGVGTDNYPTDPISNIGNDSVGASTVCFSDALGLFVAASTYKKNNLNLDQPAPPRTLPTYRPASSVATSPDGVMWTNKLIGPEPTITTFSWSLSVAFVKTGVASPSGNNGFFLMGSIRGSNPLSISPASLGSYMWRSDNGITWTQTRFNSSPALPMAMTLVNKSANLENVIYV